MIIINVYYNVELKSTSQYISVYVEQSVYTYK